MIVANLVGQPNSGFESDQNEVALVLRSGETIQIPQISKLEIAGEILTRALQLRREAPVEH
jgi:phosphopantothenoylcysteine synthetase/decarboxylase